MRSRIVREGSIGLLALVGLLILGGLVFWLRGWRLGRQSYRINVDFGTVAGMQPGAPVRYRGVQVGRIKAVEPGTNQARVVLEIDSPDLIIPEDAIIEANQVGLIGETSIDIVPQTRLPSSALELTPFGDNCDPSLILCDGALAQGVEGVSYDTLIRTTAKLAERFDNPELVAEIEELVSNTSDAAAGVTNLTDEVADLTDSIQLELGALSRSATATTDSVASAARQFELTAAQIEDLLRTNQSALALTLQNISGASDQLQAVLGGLSPAVEDGALAANLVVLSENAAIASENLRQISDSLNRDDTVVQLQRTLDSAYETFENARKITADLDALTGDPEFRENLRELVNGLNGLVSLTDALEQQTELAQTLAESDP
ncbi:MAG: MlaD family protein [Cyanobacteria bacterium P01_A01_bin.135]